MIYNYSGNIIEESLKELKVYNHNKREKYVNKLISSYEEKIANILLDYLSGNCDLKSSCNLDGFSTIFSINFLVAKFKSPPSFSKNVTSLIVSVSPLLIFSI